MLYSWYSLYITFYVHNMLYRFCCFVKACICCYIFTFTVHLLPQSSPLTSEQLLWGRLSNVHGCNIIFVLQRAHDMHGCTTCNKVFSLWACVRVCAHAPVYGCAHSFVLLHVFAWVWNQFSTPLLSVRLVEETEHLILNRPTSRGSVSHRGHGGRGYVSVKKTHFQFLTSQKMLYKSIDMWAKPSWPEIRSGSWQQRHELIM